MAARIRMTALALVVGLVGFGVGASVITRPSAEQAGAPRTLRGTFERDALHGAFWRPAGSDAERPALRLARASWTPPETRPRRPRPDALASVRAVVRLASLD
jgi:hypothetical protein